jgi:hypothetical protein
MQVGAIGSNVAQGAIVEPSDLAQVSAIAQPDLEAAHEGEL